MKTGITSILASLGMVLSSQAQAVTMIKCPAKQLDRAVTNNLNSQWSPSVQTGKLTNTMVSTANNRTVLSCNYGIAGSLSRYAPENLECTSTGKAFRCEEKQAAAGTGLVNVIPGMPGTINIPGLIGQSATGNNAGATNEVVLDFPEVKMTFQGRGGRPQISAEGRVLSYGDQWLVKQLKPFLYHVRPNASVDFYWKINTSRKQGYFVTGGTFGELGGQEQPLNVIVQPVGDKEKPQRIVLTFTDAYMVFEPGRGNPQISAAGTVLSYGSDWQITSVSSGVYQLRQKFWRDFYWQVDSNTRQVLEVRGGQQNRMDITVK